MKPNSQFSRRLFTKNNGFTLVEVIIAATLTLIVTSGVLATTLLTAKAGYGVSHYAGMEDEARRTLEIFGRDVRQAERADWKDAGLAVALTVPIDSGTATEVCTYRYNPTARTFTRQTATEAQTLLTNIDACVLSAYRISPDPDKPELSRVFDPANSGAVDWVIASNDTKQIQLSVTTSRTQTGLAKTSQKVISARFILRNKRSI